MKSHIFEWFLCGGKDSFKLQSPLDLTVSQSNPITQNNKKNKRGKIK